LSDDDLYAPELLADCLEGLRERPDAVLAHAWTAYIDDTGEVTHRPPYPLQTDDPRPVTRFRSLLYTQGGDDIYGVIRMSVLRKAQKLGSHHYSDRTFVTDLALYGAFYNVPEFLYFRRDHPQRASRATQDIRQRCTRLDPARANRWLHPTPRLLAEYILSYTSAIYRAPLTAAERFGCYRELLVWGLGHVNPLHRRQLLQSPDPAFRAIGSDALATRVSNGVLRVGQQFRGAIRKIMSGNT
jgi:hypothetical protein